jgi:gliding motility-associated GldM-like protein
MLKLPPETKVIGFTLTMDNDKGEIDVADNNGNSFTPRTISLMQNAIAGRWITIDKIRITENGAEKKIPALIYQVTN